MSIHFALVGNQNCGKSTLFNYLTGSNQHVGNFPGVTVQKKEGALLRVPNASVIDLPGIYSLSLIRRKKLLPVICSSTTNLTPLSTLLTLPILNAAYICHCS